MVVLAGEGVGRQAVIGHQELADAPVVLTRVAAPGGTKNQAGRMIQNGETGGTVVAHPAHRVGV